MIKRLSISYLLYLIPLFIFGSTLFLAFNFSNPSQSLINAISLDFIITAPLVYYFIIRKSAIPNYTAITLFVAAVFVASFILPYEHQSLISKVKYVIVPLVEVALISVIAVKSFSLFKLMRKNHLAENDFYEMLVKACEEALPQPLAKLMATEIAVIYYAFNFTGAKKLQENEYSYHIKSGSSLVLSTFIVIILVETFAIHFLLASWNTTIAWILSFTSVYACIQVIALARSLSKRPIKVDPANRVLFLRYGFFTKAQIEIEDINEVQLTARTLHKDLDMQKFSTIGALDNHNVILHLDQECVIKNVYGKERRTQRLAIFVDDREAFASEIDKLKK
jgi:hypothetical protein